VLFFTGLAFFGDDFELRRVLLTGNQHRPPSWENFTNGLTADEVAGNISFVSFRNLKSSY